MLIQAQPLLKVDSIPKAEVFYHKLGFKSIFRNGDIHMVLKKDNIVLHISAMEEEQGCQILVDDIEELYSEVSEKKIKIKYEIGDRVWGNRDFTIEDEDGNLITFAQKIETEK